MIRSHQRQHCFDRAIKRNSIPRKKPRPENEPQPFTEQCVPLNPFSQKASSPCHPGPLTIQTLPTPFTFPCCLLTFAHWLLRGNTYLVTNEWFSLTQSCNTDIEHLCVRRSGFCRRDMQIRLDRDLLIRLPALLFNFALLRCRHCQGLTGILGGSSGDIILGTILWFHVPKLDCFLCTLTDSQKSPAKDF